MIVSILSSLVFLWWAYEVFGSKSPFNVQSDWTGGVLTAAFLVVVVYLWLERLVVSRLKKGFLKAREGLLEDVPMGVFRRMSIGKIAGEYNTSIGALRAMFHTVEECQGRFLSQRNKMNTLLQSVPGVLLSLSDDLQVVVANKHAEELFSSQSKQLIGANLFDLLHLGERGRELLRDAFLYKRPIQNQEINLVTDEGPRYYSLNLGFYSDEDTDMGSVLILQDISDYRRLQDNLTMQEKMVAMGQLAAGVAHELNTPLGSIKGYAQLLGRSLGDAGQAAEYARIITDETRRCSRIVQDLLNFARADRCSGETCDVNQLVGDLIETFLSCRMQRYKIDVQMNLAAQSLVVEGSCGQLDIVLTNLLVNAIHALDGTENPSIVISSWMDDAYAVIAVADNGPGIPIKIRNRMFEPFFTTKEVGQGSGLGLPICHAILVKRGGFISYDDAYQEGARFIIKLPAVDLRRAGLDGTNHTAVQPVDTQETIGNE